jgi:hypothetical protein
VNTARQNSLALKALPAERSGGSQDAAGSGPSQAQEDGALDEPSIGRCPRRRPILVMNVPAAIAALLVFMAAAAATALALVLPGHRGLTTGDAWTAVIVGGILALAAFWHTRRFPAPRVTRRPFSVWAWLTSLAFAAFAFRAFHWLVFYDGDQLKVGSPNNLGDISLHMMLARYFANGVAWWPDHPQAAWSLMRYYPGMDLLQGLGLLLGANGIQCLFWTGLVGSALTAAALYEWGGTFAMAGFLFSGGLAGYEIFQHGPLIDYQADLSWKSLPLAIFVTQRGFLFALPAGLLLLTHWRERLFAAPLPGDAARRERFGGPPLNPGILPFWVEALLYALMPIFHLYAFLFLSALLGWWFAVYFARRGLRLHILGLVLTALLPASYEVALMTDNFVGAGGTVWFEPGWMQHGTPFLWFWLLNFGAFAVLAPALWLQCAWDLAQPDDPPLPADAGGNRLPSITRSQDTAAAFVLPAGLLFLFASMVMLSPWDWDNTKLMIWSYLIVLPFLWDRWIRPFAAIVRWPVCAALFLSGCVSLIGGLRHTAHGYGLGSRSELEAVDTATAPLPIEARFAAAPEYNHPLVFAGRKLAMGYDGHLYSQGIDYAPLARDLRALMLGLPDWKRAAQRLGVRYVYWGWREEKRYPRSRQPWAADNPPVASGDWGAIYDLDGK